MQRRRSSLVISQHLWATNTRSCSFSEQSIIKCGIKQETIRNLFLVSSMSVIRFKCFGFCMVNLLDVVIQLIGINDEKTIMRLASLITLCIFISFNRLFLIAASIFSLGGLIVKGSNDLTAWWPKITWTIMVLTFDPKHFHRAHLWGELLVNRVLLLV